ncbi:hypothetical protein O982_25660 [Mycobacterium avium 10-5581]|nr:hypothetical protein O982_25660 [Mycobacterium avium 10-5581]
MVSNPANLGDQVFDRGLFVRDFFDHTTFPVSSIAHA